LWLIVNFHCLTCDAYTLRANVHVLDTELCYFGTTKFTMIKFTMIVANGVENNVWKFCWKIFNVLKVTIFVKARCFYVQQQLLL